MTDVIEFLVNMGENAGLRHASRDELAVALSATEIAPELQAAILTGNQTQLESLLKQVPMCAALFPGKEEDDEDEDDDQNQDSPLREPDQAGEHSELVAETVAA